MQRRSRIDDTLDVFACHGIGGIIGAVAVGLFAVAGVNGVTGLIAGNLHQLGVQVLAVLVVSSLRVRWFLLAFAFGRFVLAFACES